MTGPLPPLASVDDVAVYLQRTYTEAERVSVGRWISALSGVIRARVPTIDSRIAGGSIDSETVAMVIAFAIKRIGDYMAKNAEQTGVTYPEFGATFRQSSTGMAEWLTPDDWILLGWVPLTGDGAYSVPLGWPG